MFCPLVAAVSRDPQGAVVGADVEHVRIARRFGQRRRRAALGQRDLGRDRQQVVAAIERAEDIVARRIEDLGVVARQDERRVPVEAIRRLAARPGSRANRGPLARLQMPPADVAVLALEIDEVGIARIDAADEAVAAADREPVFVDDAAVFADRRPAPGAVVLQAADDPVRLAWG